ncbi:hypothetical protein C8F04DRAFT_1061576, partial [Mycena alexandri]
MGGRWGCTWFIYVFSRLTAARLRGSGCGFQRAQEQRDGFAVPVRFVERPSPDSRRDACCCAMESDVSTRYGRGSTSTCPS